ncbi:hypothetical protein AB0B45_33500 [Nonomuraea sp. NPDC049152]|uniref:hypothetical protein n=1 Tax=Nonomuraea sp. NPDC049152 TaxID=3154350 RepID=UPI0033D1D2F1
MLAPTGAYAGWKPSVADARQGHRTLEQALDDAERSLDAGYPATALLGLKDSFVNGPSCFFAHANPLWARAYRDLGRPTYAEHLQRMMAMYQDSCDC